MASYALDLAVQFAVQVRGRGRLYYAVSPDDEILQSRIA